MPSEGPRRNEQIYTSGQITIDASVVPFSYPNVPHNQPSSASMGAHSQVPHGSHPSSTDQVLQGPSAHSRSGTAAWNAGRPTYASRLAHSGTPLRQSHNPYQPTDSAPDRWQYPATSTPAHHVQGPLNVFPPMPNQQLAPQQGWPQAQLHGPPGIAPGIALPPQQYATQLQGQPSTGPISYAHAAASGTAHHPAGPPMNAAQAQLWQAYYQQHQQSTSAQPTAQPTYTWPSGSQPQNNPHGAYHRPQGGA